MVDWTAVEADYCERGLGVAEIVARHGLNRRRLYAEARRRGWPRRRSAPRREVLGDIASARRLVKQLIRQLDGEVKASRGGVRGAAGKAAAVLVRLNQGLKLLAELEDRFRQVEADAVDMQRLREEDEAILERFFARWGNKPRGPRASRPDDAEDDDAEDDDTPGGDAEDDDAWDDGGPDEGGPD